ncbi:hypothetical protein [Spirillospora sp. CA-294931]|uniref:hypothetical protein n=1 Tax=Spirillospora sp. CA-294931 TaxID=3240042 RepID=UPI003D9031C9
MVKKKLRGGTYATLGSVTYRLRPGRWRAFEVGIASTGRSEGAITVSEGGHRLLRAGDTGRTITAPGSVGLRGDNREIGDVAVRPV